MHTFYIQIRSNSVELWQLVKATSRHAAIVRVQDRFDWPIDILAAVQMDNDRMSTADAVFRAFNNQASIYNMGESE